MSTSIIVWRIEHIFSCDGPFSSDAWESLGDLRALKGIDSGSEVMCVPNLFPDVERKIRNNPGCRFGFGALKNIRAMISNRKHLAASRMVLRKYEATEIHTMPNDNQVICRELKLLKTFRF